MDAGAAMPDVGRPTGSATRLALSLVLTAAAVFTVAWCGILLTRETHRIAAIWAANAVVLAAILRRPPRSWPAFIASGWFGNAAANLAVGDALATALGLSLINTAEVLICAIPLRWNGQGPPDLTRSRTLTRFCLLAGGVAPFVSGLLAASLLAAQGAAFQSVLATWVPADALGLVALTPVLLAVQTTALADLFRRERVGHTLLVLGLVVLTLAGVFGQSRYPFLFLPFPVLVFAAFRLGFAGVGIALALTAAAALTATLAGQGPLSLVRGTAREQILVLQVFVAVAALTALQVAAVLAERARLEGALRDGEERYRLLADNASDLIVLGHMDGRRSYISPAVTSMLGYTVEEAHGVPMRDWVHPEDLGLVFATTLGLTGPGATGSVVYRLRHRDRHWIWAEAAFRRVDGEGTPTIVTAIRNITERQAQAEELKHARNVAEQAQAAAEHARATAERARASADSANQAKSDFLAAMSHEIRTPLNAVIGYADLMADSGRLPPDLRRHADLVRSAGASLLTLVNDVLDFSKVEAGAIELEACPFAPANLVDNCVSIIRAAATAKGLEVCAHLDPDLPRALVGDEARLRQVLLNLLNNAVKFTHRGSVTLAVRHEGSGPRGESLRVSVTDTGVGVAKDKQHRLFQRFSQADSTISREFGGTGLGLAICKRLVELMGGEIGVISAEGEGSTFWFTLTLPRGSLEPRLVTAPAREGHTYEPGRLLLVEDVDVNRDLARMVLQAAGHAVDVAADGAEAVRAVREKSYDLVLMDVQMPGMDGLTATRIIRGQELPGQRLPIIAMTANVLPDQVRLLHEAGMDGHVAKPFNRAELYTTIECCLRRHHVAG